MEISRQTFLLFVLNFLDAVLTLYWIKNGFATEGNYLMASLLEIGDSTFLTVKLIVGAIAATVLYNWGHLKTARYGLTIALAVYVSLMGVHLVTGLSAFGLISDAMIEQVSNLSDAVFATII